MTGERYRRQAEAFIRESLESAVPGISTDPGSAANNIMVRGGSVILAAVQQELEHALLSRDISDPDAISESDMDDNLSNLLIPRESGAKAKGIVQLHFTTRKPRSFSQGGGRLSDENRSLIWVISSDVEFRETDYFVDPSDNTFYINVPYEGEQEGEEYTADAGDIQLIIDTQIGALYVKNVSSFSSGEDSETNSRYLQRVKRGVSTRLPITIDGSIFSLQQLFGQKLLDVLVVGNGHQEMHRDELYDNGGVLTLGPSGTPTGIHIGGRDDVFSWYPSVNYVEVIVDPTVDLVLDGAVSPGDTQIDATFLPGTTTQNIVPASGVLVIDLGGANEETVRYSSFSFDQPTSTYTFTLEAAISLAHSANSSVKVGGSGDILSSIGGQIDILPILKIDRIQLLDPLTLSPIGDPIPMVPEDSREPGWYLYNVNPLTRMSAKESLTIRVDEKKSHPGNQPLSALDGSTSATRLLFSGSSDFTGYEGREITIETSTVTVTRTILRVVSSNQIEYSQGAEDPLPNEGGVEFSIDDGSADYLQFPFRVCFYTHTEIQEAQDVFDSGRIRVVAANTLSRGFYPTFLDFTLRYRGAGTEAEVRQSILETIQESQQGAVGTASQVSFDVSDIIAAARGDGLAHYVETPMEIRVAHTNRDGTESVQYVSPSSDVVGDLALSAALLAGATVVPAFRPPQVVPGSIPPRGRLFFGVITGQPESVDYQAVVFDGSSITFILKQGQSMANPRLNGEPFRYSTSDFDPDDVIADGVVTTDSVHKPYFGNVIIEKLGD